MPEPYIGEIRMFGGNFAPAGWALCDGQAMAISENDALFTLIGTTYGGDGQTTFNLPNLQSRFPVHMGTLAGNTFQSTRIPLRVTIRRHQTPVIHLLRAAIFGPVNRLRVSTSLSLMHRIHKSR